MPRKPTSSTALEYGAKRRMTRALHRIRELCDLEDSIGLSPTEVRELCLNFERLDVDLSGIGCRGQLPEDWTPKPEEPRTDFIDFVDPRVRP